MQIYHFLRRVQMNTTNHHSLHLKNMRQWKMLSNHISIRRIRHCREWKMRNPRIFVTYIIQEKYWSLFKFTKSKQTMTILTYSQRILDNLLDENMNITKFTHEQTISDNCYPTCFIFLWCKLWFFFSFFSYKNKYNQPWIKENLSVSPVVTIFEKIEIPTTH
jgi:hypothetical protein